ncbi:secretin N-terminal domain-containing protein [Longimicrobium sp.]|uniref:secretin N-terminal domain-containing protein n=1 Tax=Longimicrobium sp. TaxID=2029185 RepID=UPI002E310658|nr:secretin N-terminal domain-containing protein [Longimicrobium sp.]HEX6042018.1 secretin N-terminal domain-containing protein [Longimicrobium sp.]
MKHRIRFLAALALGLAAAPAQAQASACRADGARCITVTFEETEMRDVAATFVAFSGTSIVLGEGAGGRVTADIRNQSWDVALGAILQAHGLAAREIAPGLLRVDPLKRLAALETVEPLVTRVFRLRYVPAASVATSLAGVKSERGTIAVNEEANALVVTDTPAVITAMERLIGHDGS